MEIIKLIWVGSAYLLVVLTCLALVKGLLHLIELVREDSTIFHWIMLIGYVTAVVFVSTGIYLN